MKNYLQKIKKNCKKLIVFGEKIEEEENAKNE